MHKNMNSEKEMSLEEIAAGCENMDRKMNIPGCLKKKEDKQEAGKNSKGSIVIYSKD